MEPPEEFVGDSPANFIYTAMSMTDTAGVDFLGYSSHKLQELARKVDGCLARLNEEQLWARNGGHENAVGNLVLHLCGNVYEWIISSIGGAPNIRHRDAEFAARGNASGEELRERLRTTVSQATTVMAAVTVKRLADRLIIQGVETSVLGAIYHVVEHFAMHTGQIIFITKMRTGAPLDFSQDSQLQHPQLP